MNINWILVLGSAVVGTLVGLTGAGGGALMTPMLILLFGVAPSKAISSDLVAAVLMRPFGGAIHLAQKNVNLALVGWLSVGSVPAAFLGALALRGFGNSKAAQTHVELALGIALLLGATAMGVRNFRRSTADGSVHDVRIRPALTVLIGAAGGLIVGLTSVGSGSLMIVLLLTLYPMIGAKHLVGTDLVQAIPLTAAAAVGQLIFGHVVFGVTFSIVIGSVPAVVIGSLFSSRAPDHLLRPVIMVVLFASGLKYVGASPSVLGSIVGVVIVAVAAVIFSQHRGQTDRKTIPVRGLGVK